MTARRHTIWISIFQVESELPRLTWNDLLGAEPPKANGVREVGQQVTSGVNQREQQEVPSTNPEDTEEEPGH